MAIPIFYTDSAHHVSLSIPGSSSKICKNIGLTASANFLVPTIEYIIQCITKGDLGIADNIKRTKAAQNLNKCSNPETLKFLSNSLGVSVNGDPEKYRKNGRYSIPESEVSLNAPGEAVGLKMIEQVAVKSILDQYKPWIEIAKLLIQHLAQIEDIIARIMALTMPSEMPKGNAGSGTARPKALGYGGAQDIKKSIGKLNSMQKKVDAIKKKKDEKKTDGSGKDPNTNTNPSSGSVNPDGTPMYEYTVISTVYSTGVFKEGIDYQYEYIDIPDDEELGDLDDTFDGIDLEDNDPYKGLRPKTMIFGIYDSKGNEISPTDAIRKFDIDQNGQVTFGPDVDVAIDAGIQSVQKADWLLRTGRWYGSFPRFGANGNGLVFAWRKGGSIQYSGTNPSTENDPGWKQLFYQDKDRNIGDNPTDSNNQANPPVLYFSQGEKDQYKALFEDIIDKKFSKVPESELSGNDKSSYKQKIMTQFDAQIHLESMAQNGFLPGLPGNLLSSNGSPTSVPLIGSYKARKLTINGKEIWIDPETEYDMKVIQIDHSSRIRFKDDTAQGSPEVDAEILRFVKNSIELNLINANHSFNIDAIRRTGQSSNWEPYVVFQTNTPGRYENITQFTIDNWDYKDPDNSLSTANELKFPNMNLQLRVTSDTPTTFWQTKSSFTWENGSDKFILGKQGLKWKIGKYSESFSNGNDIISWSINQYSEFTLNDSLVSKVRVKTLSSKIADENVIFQWYYNNAWQNIQPPSWTPNQNINDPKSIYVNDVVTGQMSSAIGNPGQTFNTTTTRYEITGVKYLSNDSDTTLGATSSGGDSYVQRYKFKVKNGSLVRTFETINFENEPNEFISNGLSLGGRLKLGDSSYAYFNNNTYELNKWEYLLFDSDQSPAFMPVNVGEKRSWSLNYVNIGNNYTLSPLTTETSVIPPNQIRLKENNNPFGRLLDPRKITNSHLAEDNPLGIKYSNGIYGHPSPNQKQKIERLFRYMKSEYDTETYYIVEGVLADENNTGGPPSAGTGAGSGSSGSSGGYYKKPHALGAIKVFISTLSDIFSKLIPAINKLIELFKNPASFIVEIIKEKLGDSSLIFSKEFLNDFTKLESMKPLDRKEFVKNSSLGEYVYVNPITGDYRALFDGAAIKKLGPLFGATLTFGIEVKKVVPKLIFKIDLAPLVTNSLDSILKGTSKDKNLGGLGSSTSSSGTPPRSSGVSSNQPVNSILDGESVTITYSTGKFIEGVKYQYIYVTEYVERLVKEADDLAESDDPDQMNLALGKYDAALQEDPNNQLILDRINSLMNKIPNYMQPIMDLLLALVTGPLKLVADVVQFIMDFFQNLSFSTLPADVIKFITFSWLIKQDDYSWSSLKGGFFTPNAIFATFGLEVLPLVIPPPAGGSPTWDIAAAKFATYVSGQLPDAPNLKKPILPGMPVKNGSFDLNEVLDLTFIPFLKRPTIGNSIFPVGAKSLSKDHILTLFKKFPKIQYDQFKLIGVPPIIELIAQFICFLEAIINAVIDLFWAILGLEVLIPPPHINLCKKFNAGNMKPQDIMDLLNGDYKDTLPSGDSTDTDGDGKPDYEFIYEIRTSDGRDIRELNQEELQKWIDENSGYDFEFLFNR